MIIPLSCRRYIRGTLALPLGHFIGKAFAFVSSQEAS